MCSVLCASTHRARTAAHAVVIKRWEQKNARQATAGRALTSAAPKISESLLAEFGVTGGVLDRAMAKPVLNRPRVMPCISQGVPACVSKHVHVNLEREAGTPADPFALMPTNVRFWGKADIAWTWFDVRL